MFCSSHVERHSVLDRPSQDRQISSGTEPGCESQGAVVSGNLDNNTVSGGDGVALLERGHQVRANQRQGDSNGLSDNLKYTFKSVIYLFVTVITELLKTTYVNKHKLSSTNAALDILTYLWFI